MKNHILNLNQSAEVMKRFQKMSLFFIGQLNVFWKIWNLFKSFEQKQATFT